MQHHKPWTLSDALKPLLSTILAITYALYILAYPPQHRKLAFLVLCLPVALAFKNQLHLTPWFSINDTFGRFLYIWLAHMSHTFLLLGSTPTTSPRTTRKDQLKEAYNQLFARHPPNTTVPAHRNRTHALTRIHFCLHHVAQATLTLSLLYTWDQYLDPPSSHPSPPTSLLRRLPSLNAAEWYERFAMTVSVCVCDMLYFETQHSIFALLVVGVLRLDEAGEWGTRLFGSLADCWSVRRYWGVYWHDYVSVSFSGHVKGLSRGCLGMGRESWGRRVVENGGVFLVSGGMHSVVRWVQTGGEGEVWCVAFWYAGQMVALVGEGVVERLWEGSVVKRWLGERVGEEAVVVLERVVGYVWVFCWMFWSVPKYLLTRNEWEMEKWRRKYSSSFDGYDESVLAGLAM
ncbi:hypothetical protein EKO04_009883 [Ascochyta lentis]|uniref:Wax synthase domain-containing protein n=1 Tax=Ascochyta lentis TaxID=205686 RepID=A0A8H7IU54_9PLEO|nr:hypothetical protein EKO04_009883 [Ascochyta lentis]